MKRSIILSLLIMGFALGSIAQEQDPLPKFSVKNLNNRIVVSWINDYSLPVTTLSIQRSYDSLKNFTTIGSVLQPQNRENGYSDLNFPYNRMYYRIFISFSGGSYVLTPSQRPLKDTASFGAELQEIYPWMRNPGQPDPGIPVPVTTAGLSLTKESHVIIHLPEFREKKYSVRFFDEAGKMLFELSKLNDEYMVLEKVYFVRSGRYRYELYENGKLILNDFVQIAKDMKKL